MDTGRKAACPAGVFTKNLQRTGKLSWCLYFSG